MPENKYTSPFATANTPAEEVEALIKVGLAKTTEGGIVSWTEIQPHTEINYSRGWLIVRHAWLTQNDPEVLVDWKKVEAVALKSKAKQEEANNDPKAYERLVVAPVVTELRKDKSLSWGEIAVRCGFSESRVRKAFKMVGAQKDIGLRIGKGGRFVYGDPVLYQDNRRREGAEIPVDYKGRPTPEVLLNFRKEEAVALSA